MSLYIPGMSKDEPVDFIEGLASNFEMINHEPNILVTVGSGGDYATINDALRHLSKKHPIHHVEGHTAEIKLLSDFVMEEQVLVEGINLGWIIITSEDEEVVIRRSSLSKELLGYPAFGARCGTLPVIGALFNMDSSADGEGRHGVAIRDNSKVIILENCGVKNAGANGLSAQSCSTASALRAIFTNSGARGVDAYRASIIEITLADVSGAGSEGVYSAQGSTVQAEGANARMGSTDSNRDFRVVRGSTINAPLSTGGTSQSPNTLTNHGIIFK